MGSALSGALAELYLQRIEKEYIKQWIDSEEIYCYKRYVDEMINVYKNNRIQEEQILPGIKHIDKNLSFKLTTEHKNGINFLDMTIDRKENKLEIGIYRKETSTDTTIHYTFNHPIEHKMAAFRYYINRLLTLPLTQEGKNKEWAEIHNMAKTTVSRKTKLQK